MCLFLSGIGRWAELVIITDWDCFLCLRKLLTTKVAKKGSYGRKENLKPQRAQRSAAGVAEKGYRSDGTDVLAAHHFHF